MDLMMVIKTYGLKYDDRLRKECSTLRQSGWMPPNCSSRCSICHHCET